MIQIQIYDFPRDFLFGWATFTLSVLVFATLSTVMVSMGYLEETTILLPLMVATLFLIAVHTLRFRGALVSLQGIFKPVIGRRLATETRKDQLGVVVKDSQSRVVRAWGPLMSGSLAIRVESGKVVIEKKDSFGTERYILSENETLEISVSQAKVA